MSIYSSGHPPLPSLHPHPEYSFYPYPITPRSQLHSTLQSSYPSSSSSSIRGLAGYSQGPSAPASIRGEAGPSTSRTKVEDRALRRAEKRAVRGLRPSGVGLGREAEDLSEEEVMMEDEKTRTNAFGQRFLLPIGRRQTQMEMDNAHSPTPSEADHDRRQEDQHGAEMTSPPPPMLGDEDEEGDEDGPGGELDLDASMEDLDGDMDDLDDEMEDGIEGDEDDDDE